MQFPQQHSFQNKEAASLLLIITKIQFNVSVGTKQH